MSSESLNRIAFKRIISNKLSFYSLIVIIFFILIASFASIISPDKTPMANNMNLELATLPPFSKVDYLIILPSNSKIPIQDFVIKDDIIHYSLYRAREIEEYRGEFKIITQTFFFGTDKYGRDLLSRIIYGSRVSLSVGFIAVLISLILGVSLGLIAGYFRGFIDDIIMLIINVVWSIPTLLMVISITLALGKGFWQIFIAVGLTMWVEVARIVRGQVLGVRELEFVEAGKALAYKPYRIIFKHILPNIIGPIIVISAANFASAILLEAGLSFLGIGVQPPIPSWGTMIRDHYAFIVMNKAYLAFLPGLAIMFLVLAFMLLGNGLRDAFDVKK